MNANKLSRPFNDEEYALWFAASEQDWSVADISEKNKVMYLIGHRECFERTLAAAYAIEAQPIAPPVLGFFWGTPEDEYDRGMNAAETLMRAAVRGGMAPSAAKEAAEHLFHAGWSSGASDQSYNSRDMG